MEARGLDQRTVDHKEDRKSKEPDSKGGVEPRAQPLIPIPKWRKLKEPHIKPPEKESLAHDDGPKDRGPPGRPLTGDKISHYCRKDDHHFRIEKITEKPPHISGLALPAPSSLILSSPVDYE